jgi:hypothetical protein
MRVRVGGRVAVFVGDSVSVETIVFDGVMVAVGIYCETACTVSAAMVFMLETAESTMFCGSRSIDAALGVLGSARAAADTMQNKLNPTTPAVRTVSGPEYCLILTLVTLLNKLIDELDYCEVSASCFQLTVFYSIIVNLGLFVATFTEL